MPSNLVTAFFAICVGFAVAMLLFLAPPLVIMKLDLATVAHDAARVAAITDDPMQVQNQINLDLRAEHLPTTWNGQTLFSVTRLQPGQAGAGYAVTSTPTSQSATIQIHYNAPLPFDRALTLFGGPVFSATVPMTASASYWNEIQYTGVEP